MSQLFPKSILLHFPSEIYLRRGVGELFPLLVRALHEKEIVTPADCVAKSVSVRDLPFEVSDKSIV